jgi:hypothetical protein
MLKERLPVRSNASSTARQRLPAAAVHTHAVAGQAHCQQLTLEVMQTSSSELHH